MRYSQTVIQALLLIIFGSLGFAQSSWTDYVNPAKLAGSAYDAVYFSVMKKMMESQGIKTDSMSTEDLKKIKEHRDWEPLDPALPDFECSQEMLGTNQDILILRGLGDDEFRWSEFQDGNEGSPIEPDLMSKLKNYGVHLYLAQYPQQKSSSDILDWLVEKFELLNSRKVIREFTLLGTSAGGILALELAKRLKAVHPKLELTVHTIASPLNGYRLDLLGEDFLQKAALDGRGEKAQGFVREIMMSYPDNESLENVKVYHHIEGSRSKHLTSFCAGYDPSFCHSLKVQWNFVPEAHMYLHPTDIDMTSRISKIIQCRY